MSEPRVMRASGRVANFLRGLVSLPPSGPGQWVRASACNSHMPHLTAQNPWPEGRGLTSWLLGEDRSLSTPLAASPLLSLCWMHLQYVTSLFTHSYSSPENEQSPGQFFRQLYPPTFPKLQPALSSPVGWALIASQAEPLCLYPKEAKEVQSARNFWAWWMCVWPGLNGWSQALKSLMMEGKACGWGSDPSAICPLSPGWAGKHFVLWQTLLHKKKKIRFGPHINRQQLYLVYFSSERNI